MARSRSASKRAPWPLLVVTGLVAGFLYIPILVVILFSFNETKSLGSFGGFSVRWYEALLADQAAFASIRVSLGIALVSMTASTVIGTMLAIALGRSKRRSVQAVQPILLFNIVTPELATAVALFLLFSMTKVALSPMTVAIGHTTFSIVYVTLIVRARYSSDYTLLEDAALDLGANDFQVLRLIVLPLLWPAILGAMMIAFLFSFDDFVTSFFLSGSSTPPIPVFIYGSIRFGMSPEINAIGTSLMTISIILAVVGNRLSAVRHK